jgi:hypothetical protein
VTFDDLPTSIELGPSHEFGFQQEDNDWVVDDRIDVRMEAGGASFFDGTVDDFDTLFVRLDRGDGSARVTADWSQHDLLAGEASACHYTITQRVRGYRDFRMIGRCAAPVRRPRVVIIACGDGNSYFARLRWRGWNRNVARATGRAYANTCDPYCAAGTFVDYPIRVRAWRLRRLGDDDHYAYMRLRVRFPAGRPAGSDRVQTYRAFESDDFFFWRG